jgi:hypothetical protein
VADQPTIFTDLGIRLADFVGGLAGGTASAIGLTKSNFYNVMSSMVVGALTASYVTELVNHFAGLPDKPAAFFVGVAGMAICQGVTKSLGKWFPYTNGKSNQ